VGVAKRRFGGQTHFTEDVVWFRFATIYQSTQTFDARGRARLTLAGQPEPGTRGVV